MTLVSLTRKALVTVDRSVSSRLERYLTFCSTSRTHGFVHLAWPLIATKVSSPSLAATVWAAAGLVQESPRFVELLLACGKGKLIPAVTAH